MHHIIWLIIMIPCSVLFTGIGIYARNRKKPMWFWSGISVDKKEISDIPAYNRANGRMWILFSLIFWISAFAGLFSMRTGGIILCAGSLIGIPLLIFAYRRIYRKYGK